MRFVKKPYQIVAQLGGLMRMPNQQLMDRKHYIIHARKLIERRRSKVEESLNCTTEESIFLLLANYGGFGLGLTLLFCSDVGFIYSFISGVAFAWIVGFILLIPADKHPPGYGRWSVSTIIVGGYYRGGKAQFLCRRIVDGVVVEELTKD